MPHLPPRLHAFALAALLTASTHTFSQMTQPTSRDTFPTPPGLADRLAKLPPSPRLLMTDADAARVRAAMEKDPVVRGLADLVIKSADLILKDPVLARKMEGRRLLGTSRLALRRVAHLGMAYRLTGDKKYADRAERDLLAAAAFSDWNPPHFLDVAELSAAVALGLDWFHDTLPPDSRTKLRAALLTKGLEPSYGDGMWWLRGTNNWNQVCHAGMVMAALELADEHPDLAARTIARAVDGLPVAMDEYAPDGAYPEGPGYWEYGTSFNVLAIASLRSALGTDFGLAARPGFDRTAEYFLHATGPSGLYFNYSDCGQRSPTSPAPAQYYLATLAGDRSLLFTDRQFLTRLIADPARAPRTDRMIPFLLLWSTDDKSATSETPAPAALHYAAQGHTPVAFHRSAWTPDAAYVAIKAGTAATNHAHMDAGTFVLDLAGQRWADDLGMQDYESIESKGIALWNMKQDSPRWDLFRLNNLSHNVLSVDGKHHVVAGVTRLLRSSPDRSVLDLAPAYAGQLAAYQRGVRLLPSGSVLIRDEFTTGPAASTVRWAAVTKAAAKITPDGFELTRNGKTVLVRVTAPNATLRLYSTEGPHPVDAKNPGTTFIGFEAPLPPNTPTTWSVEYSLPTTPPTPQDPTPLSAW